MLSKARNKANVTSTIVAKLLAAICLVLPIASRAQCAMCRASLESSGDNAKVEAVNDGIVFLMAIPYIIVAVIGYVVYRMYAKRKSES